jgi:alkylation response protein AidB-like acyl-CoA dehydrogenase
VSDVGDDLKSLLDVVEKVAASAAARLDDDADPSPVLAEAGLVELAQDTAEEHDSLVWLTHVTRVVAETSPSLGFALAARYAADRALGERAAGLNGTFALASTGSPAVVPAALAPDTVVVLDTDDMLVRTAPRSGVPDVASGPRTGLRRARLETLAVPAASGTGRADAPEVLGDWDLLTGAVLLGIARAAVASTSSYVMERRQFGAPIGSFAGLRALIAEMVLRTDGLEALLLARTTMRGGGESVSAVAGRVAVDTCIDAIQAHGGYGYIEEYPVAELLRDAISVQARAGGRRLHVARVAETALGSPDRARA